MRLVEKLDLDFKTALKTKNAKTLSILRLVRSAIKNLEIERQGAASDEDAVEILQRELKQHKESLDAFKKANRPEQTAKQEEEILILQEYLPEKLSHEELKDVIERVIEETNASGPGDLGKVMGAVMPQVKGRADGDAVGQMVRDLLG